MADTTSLPAQVCGSFFFDNVPTVAQALDIQNQLKAAGDLLTTAQAAANAAVATAQQAVNNADYFLTGDLRGLPTSPDGLASGSLWNNGGDLALVS